MEVGGAVASALLAAFSLPCLVLLLVLGEAGLRVAALALRGGRPTRSALLGYRIARPAAGAPHHYSPFRGDDDEPPLPPECCDRLAVAVYRRQGHGHGGAAAAGDPECAFCLSAVRDGDETRDLRCRHVFHRACIDAWLVRSRATCPLCRDRLLPADPTPRARAEENDEPDGYFVDDSSVVHASAYARGGGGGGGSLWHMM